MHYHIISTLWLFYLKKIDQNKYSDFLNSSGFISLIKLKNNLFWYVLSILSLPKFFLYMSMYKNLKF